jgi:hypothetical protein
VREQAQYASLEIEFQRAKEKYERLDIKARLTSPSKVPSFAMTAVDDKLVKDAYIRTCPRMCCKPP